MTVHEDEIVRIGLSSSKSDSDLLFVHPVEGIYDPDKILGFDAIQEIGKGREEVLHPIKLLVSLQEIEIFIQDHLREVCVRLFEALRLVKECCPVRVEHDRANVDVLACNFICFS